MRKSLIAASLLAAFAGPVLAEDSPHTLTGNVGVTSDYRYRGISQTEKRVALQGGVDYSHASGLYLGTWASNVSWFDAFVPESNNSLEWDFYGGYKTTLGPFGVDVGLLQYFYPGSQVNGVVSPNTLEGYVGLSWEFLSFKYSHSFSNLFGFADSKGSQYYDLTASKAFGDYTVTGHFGRQHVANLSSASYNDWKIGVSRDVLGFTVGLSYVDTDTDVYTSPSGRQEWSGNTWVLSVGKTF